MNSGRRIWIVLFLGAIMLSACGASETPDDVNAVMTEGVGTMVAAFFHTQTAMVTPASQTPMATETRFATVTSFASLTSPALPTSTLFYFTPTRGTPTPTGTFYTSTPNPGALAYGCNNLAFIRDVTIPAGTVLQRGQEFVKTWKVQNTGTCEWLYQYAIVPLGDDMGGGPTKIQKLVTVGDWSEISVGLDAPRQPGTYTSYWRMATSDGNMFGATLVVSFKVEDPPTPVPPSATFTNSPVPTSTDTPTMTPTP